MGRIRRMTTEMYDFFTDKKVDFDIQFQTNMDTVFDLSFFLVDFQAVVNGLKDIIATSYDTIDCINSHVLSDFKEDQYIVHSVENSHPAWQKEIENNVEKILFPEQRLADEVINPAANVVYRPAEGYKQTTSRNFNKKYKDDWQLKNFSKGSLLISLGSTILNCLIAEFISELFRKKTGKNDSVKININNSIIQISGGDVNIISKNSNIENLTVVNQGNNFYGLDIKKYIDEIIREAAPDQDAEGSVRRLLKVLDKNNIITQHTVYDSRGLKTIVRDVDRMAGNFFDVRT